MPGYAICRDRLRRLGPGLRLLNVASVAGRENLQAGTGCGIGSRAGHQDIVWAKLWAMADSAALASARLRGK